LIMDTSKCAYRGRVAFPGRRACLAFSQVRPAHLASASTSLRWRNATHPASSRNSRARRDGCAPQR